jgi:CRISPR system Cascade subunit CasE
MIETVTRPLHLTKLVINPAHPNANQALRDINRMHQIVTAYSCPPDFGPASRAAAGLLYRLEHANTGPHLLIQSATHPDTTTTPPGFAHAGTRDLTPLLHHLHNDMTVRYRITLNATTSHCAPPQPDGTPRPRGTRTSLTGHDALTWWHSKAPHHGLQPHATATADTTKLRGRKKTNTITIAATTIEGTAQITDTDALCTTIHTGIGRARAYGCGLLSLAPIHN